MKVWNEALVNIYDSVIGDYTKIANFVEIGGATVGCNCKIEAFAFIPPGTRVGDGVFIGPHVSITNDKHPSASGAWKMCTVTIEDGASVGAGAVLIGGVTLGANCFVAAGSVVTRDVPAGCKVKGNPARIYELKQK